MLIIPKKILVKNKTHDHQPWIKMKKDKKNKRKNQKRFDSTLGFPGEGPERLKMATFNVRGLKGKEDGIHK